MEGADINSSLLSYIQHGHPQFFKNACIQAFKSKYYNLCVYLIYSHLYKKSSEEILHNVDPELLVIYGKSLKHARPGTPQF